MQPMVDWPSHLAVGAPRLGATMSRPRQSPFGSVGRVSHQHIARSSSNRASAGICALGISFISYKHIRPGPHQRERHVCSGRKSEKDGRNPCKSEGRHSQQDSSRPTVALITSGFASPEWIPAIVKAVQKHGEIVRAVMVVDEWQKDSFDIAKLRSLGFKVIVPPSIKGAALKALHQCIQSATDAQAIAVFPVRSSFEGSFILAQSRGQSIWSVVTKRSAFMAADFLSSRWLDKVVEFVPPRGSEPMQAQHKALVLRADGKKSFVQDRDKLVLQLQQSVKEMEKAHEDVIEALVDLGYLDDSPVIHTWRIQAAVTRFCFANGLGGVPIMPFEDGVIHAYKCLSAQPSRQWRSDPGNLAFFLPFRKGGQKGTMAKEVGRTAAAIVAGGGPFIAKISPDLVQHVLRRLGFIQKNEVVCKEAIRLFCESGPNSIRLAEAGFSRSKGAWETQLHKVFSRQNAMQTYLCAPSDVHVKEFLAVPHEGEEVKVNKESMKQKMCDFLLDAYPDSTPPTLYAGLVRRMLQHINQNDPSGVMLQGAPG